MRLAVALLALASCAPAAPPELTSFPEPSELPERAELPDLFLSATDSQRATTRQAWEEWRKPQLTALFSHYQFGFAPKPVSVRLGAYTAISGVVPGAEWIELDLVLDDDAPSTLHVALILPSAPGASTFPVILGLNKCGNQSLVDDPRVRLTTSFVSPACGADAASTRGVQKSLWPLEKIVARGYAVATFHESDAAPDDDALFADGLRARFRSTVSPRDAWATRAQDSSRPAPTARALGPAPRRARRWRR